jgi:hypothetical protein
MASVEILKNTGWPAFTLMSVAKPWMFGEPAPTMYHSLKGLPSRQFSASIGFCGDVQLAKAERAIPVWASTKSRFLLSTIEIPFDLGEQPVEVFSGPLGDEIGNQLICETVCKFA